MPKLNNLIGQRFGQLTVIGRKVHNDPNWLIDWIEMYREWKA